MLGRRKHGKVVVDLWSGPWSQFACDLSIVSHSFSEEVSWPTIRLSDGSIEQQLLAVAQAAKSRRHICFSIEEFSHQGSADKWMKFLKTLIDSFPNSDCQRVTTIVSPDIYEAFFNSLLSHFPEGS